MSIPTGKSAESNMIERETTDTLTAMTDEEQRDLVAFRALRPFLGQCLSLNHDINNPLAGILGYAEFILTDDKPLDDDTKSNLQQIIMCANRIKDQIDSLSRLKSQIAEEVDLESLDEACQEYRQELPPSAPHVS